jgi:hypothetical protein
MMLWETASPIASNQRLAHRGLAGDSGGSMHGQRGYSWTRDTLATHPERMDPTDNLVWLPDRGL